MTRAQRSTAHVVFLPGFGSPAFAGRLATTLTVLKFILLIINMQRMHIRTFDLNLMPIFSALLSHGSVSDAAAQLGMTQPAVSHALARLRQHYGDPLFQRVGNRMAPTARALEIGASIDQSLEALARTFQTRFDPHDLKRTFRIGLVQYSGFYILPALTERLAAEAPHVRITPEPIDGPKGMRMIATRELDFGAGVLGATATEFQRDLLFKSGSCVIMKRGHSLSGRRLTPRMLSLCRRVSIPTFASYPAERLHPPADYAITCPDLLSVPLIVARSDLLAIVPTRLGRMLAATFDIEVANLGFKLPEVEVELVCPVIRRMDKAQLWLRGVLLDICKDIEQQMESYYMPAANVRPKTPPKRRLC